MKVCSNHFVDGKPTTSNPKLTLFLTQSDLKTQKSHKKRRTIEKQATPVSAKMSKTIVVEEMDVFLQTPEPVPLFFTHLTRECDVHFFTGFQSTDMFKLVFSKLYTKAKDMLYWKGKKKLLMSKHHPQNILRG